MNKEAMQSVCDGLNLFLETDRYATERWLYFTSSEVSQPLIDLGIMYTHKNSTDTLSLLGFLNSLSDSWLIVSITKPDFPLDKILRFELWSHAKAKARKLI